MTKAVRCLGGPLHLNIRQVKSSDVVAGYFHAPVQSGTWTFLKDSIESIPEIDTYTYQIFHDGTISDKWFAWHQDTKIRKIDTYEYIQRAVESFTKHVPLYWWPLGYLFGSVEHIWVVELNDSPLTQSGLQDLNGTIASVVGGLLPHAYTLQPLPSSQVPYEDWANINPKPKPSWKAIEAKQDFDQKVDEAKSQLIADLEYTIYNTPPAKLEDKVPDVVSKYFEMLKTGKLTTTAVEKLLAQKDEARTKRQFQDWCKGERTGGIPLTPDEMGNFSFCYDCAEFAFGEKWGPSNDIAAFINANYSPKHNLIHFTATCSLCGPGDFNSEGRKCLSTVGSG